MLWVILIDYHPLHSILQDHIQQVSSHRWATVDLTWVVSKCGHMEMGGSDTWRNICRGWEKMKVHIHISRPINMEEWRNLPLWRPHVNHLDPKLVRCHTRPLRLIREAGFHRMDDILDLGGMFLSWNVVRDEGLPPACGQAYDNMTANLVRVPAIDPGIDHSQVLREFYVDAGAKMEGNGRGNLCCLLTFSPNIGYLSWTGDPLQKCSLSQGMLSYPQS